jgi:AhpD family alkylhydroperoxidase
MEVQMAITKKEKELAAVGISIAAGCKPCTDYHMKAVRQAGASDGEIRQAIQDAVCLRNVATAIMEKYGLSHLGETGTEQAAVPPRDRVAELLGLGAAFAVNCESSLENYIKSAKATGVSEEEILETAKLATFIKGKGASHVNRLVPALEQGLSQRQRDVGSSVVLT